MYRAFLKRVIDFCVALVLLLLLWPLLLFVWLVLSVANGGSGLFLQPRPGRGGKIFRVIKFKTMNDRCDGQGVLLPDGERLTKIGRFVRTTSLDELPQLINVLRGNMSLIGPRPLLVQYLPLYTPQQARRHELRPGITGWAQVNGRNLCLLSKKFEYDTWYVDNISFVLDCKIVLMTIQKVFRSSDVGLGAASMEQVDDLNFMERMKI